MYVHVKLYRYDYVRMRILAESMVQKGIRVCVVVHMYIYIYIYIHTYIHIYM